MNSVFRKSMGALWHMWQALVIQDGVWPPSWITVSLIFLSNLIITNQNLAGLFPAGSIMLSYIFVNLAFEMIEIYSRWRPTTILQYYFIDYFVKSQYKKLKICWFVSCKVIHVGLYVHKCSFSNDWNIQDGVRTAILEYYFVNNFVKSHNKKLKFCSLVSCKVFHVGLYF